MSGDAQVKGGQMSLAGFLSMAGKYTAREIDQACESAHSCGVFRCLMRSRTRQEQFQFVQTHPLTRPMTDYAGFVIRHLSP